MISKRGFCSRSQAEALVRAGRVRVDGKRVRDPESRTSEDARIIIDEDSAQDIARRYLMLNKPRGVITTASDEQGRPTVYRYLDGSGLPWVAPVGRLDMASEGLLLFSNDSEWSACINAPDSHVNKTYHVQIDCLPATELLDRLRDGVIVDGERLSAKQVTELRRGAKNAWLEIVLDEGRNRQIRRLLGAFDISVLRLIRVAVGELLLGSLPKGQWRELRAEEIAALVSVAGSAGTKTLPGEGKR